MKVFYKKDAHVILHFGSTELKQALGILKALAKYFNLQSLWDVAGDLEKDLQKPKLGYVMHTKLCEACAMEIDLLSDNKHETESGWFHKVCPTLKKVRPE